MDPNWNSDSKWDMFSLLLVQDSITANGTPIVHAKKEYSPKCTFMKDFFSEKKRSFFNECIFST